MNNNTMLIIRREYLERVSKKSFIITTILMPVVMLALCFLPALIMSMQTPDARRIAVVDESGVVLPALTGTESVSYAPTDVAVDSLITDVAHNYDYDGVLIVGSDVVEHPSNVKLYMHDAVPMELEMGITENIKDIVEEIRLREYNIENLPQILENVHADVSMQTYRISDGEAAGSSSMISMVIGMAMAFILYMMILMYGNMVMTSIIEEKSNRVLELVVSSVKPFQLMVGKIVGIGLVAVTQIAIWGALITSMLAFVLPAFLSPELMTEVTMVQNGSFAAADSAYDPEMLQAVSSMLDVGYILGIFAWALLFMVGGFLLYAAMYAAIASAVDNLQDASQLSYIPTIPVIISVMFAVSVGSDPTGPLAWWLSMIPFTSPMLMVARIPFGIPWWEIVLSLVILYLTFIAMVWFAGKIYRIGIFMHGKKPSVRDLIRWSRYK